MQYLVSQKILGCSNADNALTQYVKLLEEVKNVAVIEREFLDEFFFNEVSCCKYDAIFHLIKILLSIINGQTYVERGSSQNADVLQVNIRVINCQQRNCYI